MSFLFEVNSCTFFELCRSSDRLAELYSSKPTNRTHAHADWQR